VLGLLVFIGAGVAAFYKLNIEAYPNPAPVILEITAQAAGLSAEEMERYYTIPMEIGVYSTPASTTCALLRSMVSPICGDIQIRRRLLLRLHQMLNSLRRTSRCRVASSADPAVQLIGEVYRYAVEGPKNFGLTNLRTVQDWIVLRRLSTIPGVVQVNSFGGPTKELKSRPISTAARLQRHTATTSRCVGQCQQQRRRS